MSATFHGKALGGKFTPEQPGGLKRFLEGLEGQRLTVTIQKYRKARTIKQNSFLWAHEGPYATIAEGISTPERRYSVEDLHEICKYKFLRIGGDQELFILRSTTELTTVEFSEYLENIAHWAAGLGIYVAFPNEVELMQWMEKRNQ